MTDEEATREKFVKQLLDAHTAQFNAGAAYTNLIMLGGYAGAFAIWANVKSMITQKSMVVIALCLGLSLLTFVAWNVFQMLTLAMSRRRWSSQLEGLYGADYIAKYQQLERSEQRRHQGWLYRLWSLQVIVALFFASIAGALLFYNFFALLLKFPLWP